MRPFAVLALALLVSCQDVDERAALQAHAEMACAEISQKIEAFLGPKFKGPVPVRIVTPDWIGDYAAKVEETMVPAGLVETARRLAERLHQIPPGYDIQQKQVEMLKQIVAGLYDPQADRFYLVEKRTSPGSPEFVKTVAHELIHAYRDVDQDYFGKTVAAMLRDADWAIAMSCLTEGDATFLAEGLATSVMHNRDPTPMLRMIAAQADVIAANPASAPPEIQEFPLALREMFLGRYIVGLVFAAKVYAHGGLKALADAFESPPRSTEQVLHPAKYIGPRKDEPTVFSGGDPTAALGEGWKLEMASSVGEFELRVHFTEALGRDAAVKAAAGWDGGRYHFCSKQGLPCFVGLVTTWDSEKDAQEFAAAWAAWAAKRDGEERKVRPDKSRTLVVTKQGLVVVQLSGTDVLVADGVPPLEADGVLKALGEAQRRERRPGEDPRKN